jgi:hypothetical protein
MPNPKVGTPAPPATLTLTDAHRAAAQARGANLDALFDLLRGSLVEASHLTKEILASAPKDDPNLGTLKAKLLLFKGELSLFAP